MRLGDAALAPCLSLERLDICGCDGLTPAAVSGMRRLRHVTLGRSTASAAFIDAIPDLPLLVRVAHDEAFVLACFATVVASVSDNSYGPAALVELISEHTLLVRVDHTGELAMC